MRLFDFSTAALLTLSLSLSAFRTSQSQSTASIPAFSNASSSVNEDSQLTLSSTASFQSSTLPIIKVYGPSLIDSSTGGRFWVRGASYEYDVDDGSESNWRPALDRLIASIPLLNTIRFYQIDASKSYQRLMAYLQQKRIYAIIPLIPLKSPYCVLNAAGTQSLQGQLTCYPSCLLTFGQQVIQHFASYNHVLTFLAAENVMSSDSKWHAGSCVKAYVRDLKAYQFNCPQQRYVPIMVAENDSQLTGFTADQNHALKLSYLTCQGTAESIDIYGINLFRWCSDICTAEACGYESLLNALSGSPIPLLLSSYGCGQFTYGGRIVQYPNGTQVVDTHGAVAGQRSWKQTAVLYSTPYRSVFNGGIAVSYGALGGSSTAFFTGGDLKSSGSPGERKACGTPNLECSIDLYSQQLNAIFGNTNAPNLADAQVAANQANSPTTTTSTSAAQSTSISIAASSTASASSVTATNNSNTGSLSAADQAALAQDSQASDSQTSGSSKLAAEQLIADSRNRMSITRFSVGDQCPSVKSIDLTIAPSRQGADGYVGVLCASALTAAQQQSDPAAGKIVAIVAACIVGILVIVAFALCMMGRRCQNMRYNSDESTLHDYKNEWKQLDKHQDKTDKLPHNAIPDPIIARMAPK